MGKRVLKMKLQLSKLVDKTVSELYGLEISASIGIPNRNYGDFSTNAAILLASKVTEPLPAVAENIARAIEKDDGGKLFKKVDFTRTGFINFILSDPFLQDSINTIKREGKNYGRSHLNDGKKVLIEFVSANPTGPLHIGHGRWAVIGDDIASLLEATGYQVNREFYVNDTGNQVEKLEASVRARAEGKEVPEGGYGGAYVVNLAEKVKDQIAKPGFRNVLINTMLDDQKRVLRELGVGFDRFFSEKELHENGKVKEAVAQNESERCHFRRGRGALVQIAGAGRRQEPRAGEGERGNDLFHRRHRLPSE